MTTTRTTTGSRTRAWAASLCAVFLLASCAGDGGQTEQSDSGAGNAGDTVTLKHARGETDFRVTPEKVVAIGPAVDNLLALGIVPDAVVQGTWDRNFPWNEKQLEGVEILEQADLTSLPVEQIAAEKPDLIVGNFWSVTDENFATLSEIAPTLGAMGSAPAEQGWKPQLEALGKIYDKEDEAAKVITDDEQLFADIRDELPGLEGKSGIIAQLYEGRFGVVTDPEEPANEFFTDLGMKLPDTLTDGSVVVESGRTFVSPERLNLLDADFMVIVNQTGSSEELHSVPGYNQLTQVRTGAVVEGMPIVNGLNLPSSLSRAWALDQSRDALRIAADSPA